VRRGLCVGEGIPDKWGREGWAPAIADRYPVSTYSVIASTPIHNRKASIDTANTSNRYHMLTTYRALSTLIELTRSICTTHLQILTSDHVT
jgi:hypothetical protein